MLAIEQARSMLAEHATLLVGELYDYRCLDLEDSGLVSVSVLSGRVNPHFKNFKLGVM